MEERTYHWADGRNFSIRKRIQIMGILNVTPDSFSDGGQYNSCHAAAVRARELEAAGAGIIDVGAESTRPGSMALTAEEESFRLMQFLPAVLAGLTVPVSVDTYHYQTADIALRAGAHILNDVWGFQYDYGEMADVAANYGVPVILMHNAKEQTAGGDIMAEIKGFLSRSIEIALAHGVKEENIIVDPGIGFGKTTEQNLEVLRRIGELADLGCPVLLAPSRKRCIGEVLNLPVTERDEGTGAVCLWGLLHGCAIVRVHNVQMVIRMARMMEALMK